MSHRQPCLVGQSRLALSLVCVHCASFCGAVTPIMNQTACTLDSPSLCFLQREIGLTSPLETHFHPSVTVIKVVCKHQSQRLRERVDHIRIATATRQAGFLRSRFKCSDFSFDSVMDRSRVTGKTSLAESDRHPLGFEETSHQIV